MTAATAFDYSACEASVRRDIPEAHRKIWDMIARPGNWWRGEDRVAFVQEARNARSCKFCARRREALSPHAVLDGEHNTSTNLPEVVVDTIHRVTTDPSRLSQTWLESTYEQGLNDGRYVELLGVVVAAISIDAFHRAMGMPLEALPEPVGGEPSLYRPEQAADSGAWVPTIAPTEVGESEQDLYGVMSRTGNVLSAMSLVPDSGRMLNTLGGVHYLAPREVANPASNGGRALSRPQIELLAGRISSLSDCFY